MGTAKESRGGPQPWPPREGVGEARPPLSWPRAGLRARIRLELVGLRELAGGGRRRASCVCVYVWVSHPVSKAKPDAYITCAP